MSDVRHQIDRLFERPISEVVFGNTTNAPGHGHVPYNAEVDYFGLRVLMRPTVFLELALPLPNPRSDTVQFLRGALSRKEAFGSPFLNVKWVDGDWKVNGHEGRHRMKAVLAEEGNDPIEVHIFPQGGMRRRHLDEPMMAALKHGIFCQSGDTYVPNAVVKIL